MAAKVTASCRFPLTRPNDGGPALVWVPAPGPCEFPCREKTSSIDRKALHKEARLKSNLLARARPLGMRHFKIFRSAPAHENMTRPAARQLRRYQTNFGRTYYGNDLNSSGGGQRREARLAQLRGGDARVQMRE